MSFLPSWHSPEGDTYEGKVNSADGSDGGMIQMI